MNEQQHGIMTKSAVLSIAALLYTVKMAGPALGAIKQAFPGVSPIMIQQLLTIPPMMMIVGSLVTARLQQVIPKKKILYIGILLQIICGIMPAFYGDITFMLITRVFFGLGYGMTFPLASSLIADLFEGKERDAMMGYKSAVGAAAGVVFQMLGGFLAAIDWRYNFLGLLILIPIYLMVLYKVPEPEKAPVVKTATGSRFGGITSTTWFIYAFNMVFNILQYSFITNVALVMASEKIGGPAQAGTVLTIFTVAALIAGVFYGKISQLFKEYTLALAFAFLGAAFLVIAHYNTYEMFLLGAILYGLGFGTYNPEITIRTIKSVDKSAVTVAMSFFVCSMGIGQFGSPFLVYIATILGFGGPKATWMIVAPTCVALCLLMIIANVFIGSKNKTKKLQG
ncbi:MFS transporter [Pelosinus fermentans]|uniref:Major facilitator superfamily MFS_1 n=1 Tax=Pelosinus fermentans B4 TaxID=1149862 RepID=I8RC16_9FIRM|nr:MFS transporter [Pelosinus fermentans]EIW16628.1 major facilitator superfamily MFS_1 [Pelosinus fermentans B4]EIW22287.1 major facilitator superfamily MFS_1 [Pelosinus fermentans A11]